MYQLSVEIENGERLELTNNPAYNVLSLEGTNPPVAAINTVPIVGVDGSKFNSSRVEQRNIVITLAIHEPIEANRLTLYRFFRTKRWLKIFYKNRHRDVFIEGYVESFENNPWSESQQPQISIICPQPFWQNMQESYADFNSVIPLFEFPFSIPAEGIEFSLLEILDTTVINAGDIATGGIIRMIATGVVVKPVFYNRTTQKFFKLNFTMQDGDIITINTQQGQKSVTLLRAGIYTNLLGERATGSTWIIFDAGENVLSYDADDGSEFLDVQVRLVNKFEGV